MSKHPAHLMIGIWGIAILVFIALPFQLLTKPLTFYGLLILAAFLLTFVVGSLLVPRFQENPDLPTTFGKIDGYWPECILKFVLCIAMFAFFIDLLSLNLHSLSASQDVRALRAANLLKAGESLSSPWFRVAFLTYPAAYAYASLHIIYSEKISYLKLSLWGALPILLATASMGGRSPMLYAFVLIGFAIIARRSYFSQGKIVFFNFRSRRGILTIAGIVLVLALALYYFSVVFLVRSQPVGGPEAMFKLAESSWGVGFKGIFSELIFAILGESLTYLIFIFSWYFVQGPIISAYIFSGYYGPWQFGIYGVDLITAIMRRVEPDRVAHGFDVLLSLNTYGFFPSAFGSLYVDFGIAGILFTGVWGYWASLCYRKIKFEKRSHWLILGPLTGAGIVFSLINTPLGFSNGLITHFWVIFVFLTLKTRSQAFTAPAYR